MANLYQVQDADRPMFVLAPSFEHALERWREFIRNENKDDPLDEPFNPQGIVHIADANELIL